MKNFWLIRRGQRLTTREINGILTKFVGHKIISLDELFDKLRKNVIKFFKKNPDKLKLFLDSSGNFDFNFDVEEQNGFITNITFEKS